MSMLPRVTSLESDQTIMLIQAAHTLKELLVWWESYKGIDSLVAQLVKNLLTMQETWVQFLGQKDLLEKEMAPQSSILAYRIPLTEEPGRLQSMGLQESDRT